MSRAFLDDILDYRGLHHSQWKSIRMKGLANNFAHKCNLYLHDNSTILSSKESYKRVFYDHYFDARVDMEKYAEEYFLVPYYMHYQNINNTYSHDFDIDYLTHYNQQYIQVNFDIIQNRSLSSRPPIKISGFIWMNGENKKNPLFEKDLSNMFMRAKNIYISIWQQIRHLYLNKKDLESVLQNISTIYDTEFSINIELENSGEDFYICDEYKAK